MRVSNLIAGASSLALAVTLAGTFAAPAQAHEHHHPQPQQPEVVADGFAGPLSLAVGRGRDVYLSQSFAGLLSKVDRLGNVSTIHDLGLSPDDGELAGVAYSKGATFHIETDYSGAEGPVSHIVRTSRKGHRTVVSDDLWAYEIRNNPDGDQTYGFTDLDASCAAELAVFEEGAAPDRELPPLSEYSGIVESHAYQLSVSRGKIYVADAAANAVLAVNGSTGAISTVSVIPATPIEFTADLKASLEGELAEPGETPLELPNCLVGNQYTPEPVPTDVKVGWWGTLYVSTLQGGAGEILPLSKVYGVNPYTGTTTEVAGGMYGATGLALGWDGRIFVAEMFGGQVSVIKRHSHTAKTVFEAESPSDVDLKGSTIYATTGVFGNGALVKYRYRYGW